MALKKSDVETMTKGVMEKLITGEAQHAMFSMRGDERKEFEKGLSLAIYEELKERRIAE